MIDWSPLAVSLKTSIVATVLALPPGLFAARLVSGLRGRARSLFDVAFTLPMLLPPTVLGFILLSLLGRNGPIGGPLAALGIRIVFTWGGAVIAGAVVAFPLIYRTVRGALEQIDPDLARAGRTLGLGEWTIFWKVHLPVALPGTLAGLVLAYARALGEFGATVMLAGNIPGKTQTLPVAIYFAVEGDDYRRAVAWVCAIVAISLAMTVALNAFGGKRHGNSR